MKMQLPAIRLLLIIALLVSASCKKSPRELYQQLTAKKVKRTVVAENSTAATGAQQQDAPVTDDHDAQADEFSAINLESTASQDATYKMCHALLKTMATEPYFYQFQANLRAYRAQGEHHILVKGHARHHKIDFPKTSAAEPYNECADMVLAFDRYQDVKAMWKQAAWDANAELRKRLLAYRSTRNFYSVDRCVDLITSLADESEFDALITELSRADSDHLSPEIMMGSLLDNEDTTPSESTAMISPKACIKALKSFASFQDVTLFSASSRDEQRRLLDTQRPTFIAH